MFEIWLLTKSHEGKGPISLLSSEGALSGFDSASVFQRQCKDTKSGKRNSRFLTDSHGFSRIFTDSLGFLRFFLLWFPQISENIRYLGGCEALRPLAVTGLQKQLVKRLAKDNPSSEMGTCHFGSGIWEVKQS